MYIKINLDKLCTQTKTVLQLLYTFPTLLVVSAGFMHLSDFFMKVTVNHMTLIIWLFDFYFQTKFFKFIFLLSFSHLLHCSVSSLLPTPLEVDAS